MSWFVLKSRAQSCHTSFGSIRRPARDGWKYQAKASRISRRTSAKARKPTNARSARSAMFREAFACRRCLVPAADLAVTPLQAAIVGDLPFSGVRALRERPPSCFRENCVEPRTPASIDRGVPVGSLSFSITSPTGHNPAPTRRRSGVHRHRKGALQLCPATAWHVADTSLCSSRLACSSPNLLRRCNLFNRRDCINSAPACYRADV